MAATVVIAEDSAVIRAVVRRQLEAEGYNVEEAADGLAAVTACRAVRPDAVLLDIEMPGLDGRQVLAELKRDPDLEVVPVVFLTGRTGTDDMVAGLRAGAHDYLRKPFDPAELIARIGGAVHLKLLQDELRAKNLELDRVARVDALTGVYNRRHLEEELTKLGAVVRRDRVPLSLILLDIDHFKRVNDTYGHGNGDVVLQHFARQVQGVVRAGGVVGRWGGEEFLVLLPATDLDAATVVGERIRSRVASNPALLDSGPLTITVSGGCSSTSNGDSDTLLLEADSALYQAKAAGRNRIEVRGLTSRS